LICLFGGTGFLGAALRSRLVDAGREVLVIGRSAGTGNDPCYIREADIAELAQRLVGLDIAAVIDFASATVPGSSFNNPIADMTANLTGVVKRLEFARGVLAKHFIFVSSGGAVYGEGGRRVLEEDAPTKPLVPYGVTKLAGEHYSLMYAQVHGLPVSIVRPSNVYGPGQRPFLGQGLVATAMGCALAQRPLSIFGDGSAVRDYLYVDDFTDGMLAILGLEPRQKVFNLGSQQGTAINELIAKISTIAAADGSNLEIAWQVARPFDVTYNVLDCGALRQASGWEPRTNLHKGLVSSWRSLKKAE
jgi:UDP-glucose 4-epimerase